MPKTSLPQGSFSIFLKLNSNKMITASIFKNKLRFYLFFFAKQILLVYLLFQNNLRKKTSISLKNNKYNKHEVGYMKNYNEQQKNKKAWPAVSVSFWS